MKVEELRIGNWYYFSGSMDDVWDYQNEIGVLKLNNSFQYYVEFKNISNELLDHFTLDQIEPIPLTPDILEKKCGFEKVENGDRLFDRYEFNEYLFFWDNYSNEIHAVGVEMFDENIKSEGLINFAWHIKYLHQLQNLYYALTYNELNIQL